jgi:ketosteroid isomerase-like protein
MNKFATLFLTLTAAACAADHAGPLEEIRQTEHDFCVLVQKDGRKAGFSTYVAIPSMYALDRAEYRARTPEFQPGESVQWQPVFTAVSASGDFGYVWSRTAGSAPNTANGKPGESGEGLTFTVWRKQADGTWRFIFDAGSAPSPEALRAVLQNAAELSAQEPPTLTPIERATATGEVRAVLASFFATAKTEGRNAALLLHMSAGALMLDTNVCTKTAAAVQLPVGAADTRPEGTLLYVDAAATGDLAFALGEWAPTTSNSQPTPPRLGVWLWQRQPDGSWLFTTYHELPVRPERLAAIKARIASLR